MGLKSLTVREGAIVLDQEVARRKASTVAPEVTHRVDRLGGGGRPAVHQGRGESLPAGTTKTAMVGGRGGGEFIHVGDDLQPVVGFRYELGDWMGRGIIRAIDPIYVRPHDDDEAESGEVVTKPGYVVGGLWVDGTEYADAFRVIFVRQTAAVLDPNYTYRSGWIGKPQKQKQTELAGEGQTVVGIFGRKGLNIDGLGLVVKGVSGDE